MILNIIIWIHLIKTNEFLFHHAFFSKDPQGSPRPFSRIAACRCAKCLERMRISLRRIRSPKRQRVMLWESPSVPSKQATMVGMKSHHWDKGGCLWMLNITGMGFMIYKRSKATCVIDSITTIICRLRYLSKKHMEQFSFRKLLGISWDSAGY